MQVSNSEITNRIAMSRIVKEKSFKDKKNGPETKSGPTQIILFLYCWVVGG